MAVLRLMMLVALLVALPVCYLLYFISPPTGNSVPGAQGRYKRGVDQVREAVKQVRAQRTGVDPDPQE